MLLTLVISRYVFRTLINRAVGEFSVIQTVIPVKHVPAEAGSRNPENSIPSKLDARRRGHDE
jgi:hypothetical protein